MRLHRQVRPLRYNVTLWRVRVAIFLCVVGELHFIAVCVRMSSVVQQCLMVNLCHRQQCKLYVSVLKAAEFQLSALFSHVVCKRCIETQVCSFAYGLFQITVWPYRRK